MKNLLARLFLFAVFVCLAASAFAGEVGAPAQAGVMDVALALLTVVSSALAIWKHIAAGNTKVKLELAEDITHALIVGIEDASKKPGGSQVKETVQSAAQSHGVEPHLHEIVQNVTEGTAK